MQRRKRAHYAIFLAAMPLFLLLQGCAGARPGSPAGRDEAEVHAEILRIYQSGNYETTLKWIRAHEDESVGKGGALRPRIVCIKGLALLRLARPAEALAAFEQAAREGGATLDGEIAYYKALALHDLGRFEEGLAIATPVSIQSLPASLQPEHRVLLARLHLKRRQWVEAALTVLEAARAAPADARSHLRQLGALMDEALGSIEAPADLRILLQEFPRTPVSDRLIYRLALIEHREGSSVEGDGLLRQLLLRFPESPLAAKAEQQLQQKNLEVPVEGLRVGVLVPRSGKLAGMGDRALQAIRMGIRTAPRLREKLVIVAEDSGDTPRQMVEALERLVQKHRVLAVIGPVTSNGIDSVSRKAQLLGVPLLSLARRDAPDLDYVFEAGVTLERQLRALVEFVIRRQGKKRFALLYPRDGLGEAASGLFWDLVEQNGGEIRAVASYSPEESDFREVVDGLSGASAVEARAREVQELARKRAILKVRRKNRRNERYFNLTPVIDFDAVFVPDTLRVAGQILPTFTFRDIEKLNFVGTSLWNSPDAAQLLSKEEKAKTLWFVDVFSNPEPEGAVARRFIEQFRALGHGIPGPIEALGFDAGAILADAVSRIDGAATREKLRRSILESPELQGVTGRVRLESRSFVRELTVYSIHDGEIRASEAGR